MGTVLVMYQCYTGKMQQYQVPFAIEHPLKLFSTHKILITCYHIWYLCDVTCHTFFMSRDDNVPGTSLNFNLFFFRKTDCVECTYNL